VANIRFKGVNISIWKEVVPRLLQKRERHLLGFYYQGHGFCFIIGLHVG
jgi:hypothetical protein